MIYETMLKQGVVAKQCGFRFNGIGATEAPELAIDAMDVHNEVIAFPERDQTEVKVRDWLLIKPSVVRLNLEDLRCFEVVERQYQRWGVIFNNCVALQPSNPAFPPQSGTTVLMGAPKTGFLEATFCHPVHFVSSLVTTSQRTVLTAYDGNCQLIAETEMPHQNLANVDESFLAPNILMSLKAPNIRRVTFCAFDGPFTIDDFRFIF